MTDMFEVRGGYGRDSLNGLQLENDGDENDLKARSHATPLLKVRDGKGA